MNRAPTLYALRIRGHLGATGSSAFPEMVSQHVDDDTVLTGLVADRSALFALLARVEALGLELLELRQLGPKRRERRSEGIGNPIRKPPP